MKSALINLKTIMISNLIIIFTVSFARYPFDRSFLFDCYTYERLRCTKDGRVSVFLPVVWHSK